MNKKIKNLALSALFGISSASCHCFPSNSCCFEAGTRIDTPKGPRDIDGLMKGEKVWAWDLRRGDRVVRRIEAIQQHMAQVLCRIEVGDSLITGVTPEHPFFQADTGKFVALRDLPANALLLRMENERPGEARVGALKITEHPKPCVPVFNLSVEGPEHNYFAEGVLVHNKAPIPPSPYPDAEEYRVLADGAGSIPEIQSAPPQDAAPASDHGEDGAATD